MSERHPNDSTANDNGGVLGGTANVVGGIAGGALDFPGNGYVRLDADPTLDFGTATATVSGWIRFNAIPATDVGITRMDGKWSLGFQSASRIRNLLVTTGKNGWTASNDMDVPGKLATGQWYYLAMTYDSAAKKLVSFWNAAPLGTGFEVTGDLCASPHNGSINHNNANAVIDEVRVERVARSANWLWACYMNLTSPTFCKYEMVH